MPDTHLAQMFFDRADRVPDRVAVRYRHKGAPYTDLTFRKMKERVQNIAAGLLSIDGGLEAGRCVSIFANTRVEWVCADYAVLALGCKTVPVYASLLPAEVAYIHQDTQAEVAIVENKSHVEKIRETKGGFTFFDVDYPAEKIKLRKMVVIDPEGLEPADDWESLAELEKRGAELLDEKKAEIEDRGGKIKREDVATYVYTSGTTGPPKGVIQTHHNHLSILENAEETGMFNERTQAAGAFLFLPLAHSFGRLIEFGSAFYEAPLIISSPDTLLEDLQATRPGFFPAAPRVFEKIYSKFWSGVASAPAHRQFLARFAINAGTRWLHAKEKGQKLGGVAAMQHRLADKLVLSKIRERLGFDRVDVMLSGSAPLSKEVQEFFGAAGLIIYEAYGLTETCPGLTANRFDKWRTGTVGPVLKGVELKIAEDGEILAKGPNITPGYLNRPDANEDAFEDGWFHTGDIGEFDKDGFLRITDRKKDLIKTSGGKYVAPQKIEGKLKNQPLVFEAAVIGDGRKYCVALIALDEEELEAWSARTGKSKDPRSKDVIDEVQGYIDEINRDLASFESVKYFRFIDEAPSVDNGMLTASFKLKRRVVAQRYADLIDEMYEDPAKKAA